MFEHIEHFYIKCQHNLNKYIMLFAFFKLQLIEGKTIILASGIDEAYKIKLFLQRFKVSAFVVNPDQPKNQQKGLIHFLHIGQFDILILLHSGY